MDIHVTRGFNPLSGRDIIDAMCGSLRQELEKHDFLSINLAYPMVKWTIVAEVELASNTHAQMEKTAITAGAGYQQTDEQNVPVETGEPGAVTVETSHESEFPDLTRELFIDGAKPAEPESAISAIAPTAAAIESFPEKFRR
jgi:hypothetical protein